MIRNPRESDVLKAVMDYLSAQGFVMFRRNTGAMKASHGGKSRFIRFSQKGMADLWGVQKGTGRHIECEVKAPGKRPSPEQVAWLQQCIEIGCIAFWCEGVEECKTALIVQTQRV
jgi:hypothetical protein